MNTIKRFWALCLDTHMKLALYEYAIIIIILYKTNQNDYVKGLFSICKFISPEYHESNLQI